MSGAPVPMRNRENSALIRLFWIGVAAMGGGVWFGVDSGEWDAAGWVAVVFVAIFAPPYVYRRFRHRYTVRGDILEIRSLFGRSEVDLPTVQEIDLRAQYEEVGDKRGITQLLLIMDDVEIVLGDARSGLYFEPAGVRALSEGLLKSNLSRTC